MSFWDTFVKVWQVRTSVRIQESIEDTIRDAQRNAELQRNLPDIINELETKNSSWEKELEMHRNKNNK